VSAWTTDIRLIGAGGEPVDLRRTLLSHGFVELPPMRLDEQAPSLELTLTAEGRTRTIELGQGRRGHVRLTVLGRTPGAGFAEQLVAKARHVLGLDEDLSEFYDRAREDPELAWAADGAGRMIRSPTVFDDVVKTMCTPITSSHCRSARWRTPAEASS
jgi:3-methyladenine DNA glycosylase/8-oxoguanine DNA glycosylase